MNLKKISALVILVVTILLLYGCKNVGMKYTIECKNIQWEFVAYCDDTCYIYVQKGGLFKKLVYSGRRSQCILDSMIGDENELLASTGGSVKSFHYIGKKEIKHITLYECPKYWMVEKLIGRVQEGVWIYLSKRTENISEPMESKVEYFLARIEKGNITDLISMADLFGVKANEFPRYFCLYCDTFDDIPYCVISAKQKYESKAKLYLCYLSPTKGKWALTQIPDIFDAMPMIREGSVLKSLVSDEVAVNLDGEQGDKGLDYSKRNYYALLDDNRCVYLRKVRNAKEKKDSWKSSLMLYDAEKKEKTFLSDIPPGYWYVVKKDDNTVILRGYDQATTKDIEFDLRERKFK